MFAFVWHRMLAQTGPGWLRSGLLPSLLSNLAASSLKQAQSSAVEPVKTLTTWLVIRLRQWCSLQQCDPRKTRLTPAAAYCGLLVSPRADSTRALASTLSPTVAVPWPAGRDG